MIFLLRRPLVVLAVCGVLAGIAAVLATRVEFRTSRAELAPAEDPDQARFDALIAEFKGSEAIVACVEPAEGSSAGEREVRAFSDALAAAFSADALVERVFHRLDSQAFVSLGLYLIPPERLEEIVEGLGDPSGWIDRLANVENLTDLNLVLSGFLDQSVAANRAPPAAAAGGISLLVQLLEGQQHFLESPAGAERWVAVSPLERLAGQLDERIRDPYLSSADGRTVFLAVIPADTDDSLPARRALLGGLQEIARGLSLAHPGIRFGFTGPAAMSVEEMDTVGSDSRRSAWIAVIGVSLLTLLVFRWRLHAVLVLLALGVGVVWAYGAVYLTYGYLNLITSAFVSTLVGVGVAYGIHPVSEYELEGAHTREPRAVVIESYRRTGSAVTVAACTTSAAFLSILFMRFRGFAELGLVAGIGVLLCWVSAMTVLPALMLVHGRWRRGRFERKPRPASTLDRFWGDRGAEAVCRFPRTVVVCGLLITVLSAWAASGLRFNSNLLDLLPRDADSLYFQRKMMLDSDLSPVFNVVTAGTLEELRTMRAQAASEPTISRFDSVLDVLPQDPARTREILEPWRERLRDLQLPRVSRRLETAEFAGSFRRLESQLADAGEAAFTTGLVELAGPLEQARAAAEACLLRVERSTESDLARWNSVQQRVRDVIRADLERFVRIVTADPPGIEDLPQELRERFITGSDRFVGFLYPAGDIFDPDPLSEYVAASIRVSRDAIGFPYMLQKMSRRITSGFYRSVLAGALVVAAILWLDLRRLGETGLALAPLAVGLTWTLGAMRLLDLSFNFANLVAVPLIIGVGIDNGVHLIHRLRLEGREGMSIVLRHTGRAILIASLTTMIGFGSLASASHRGLASLGWVLLLGVGSCLLTSTVLMPNVLIVTGRVRR